MMKRFAPVWFCIVVTSAVAQQQGTLPDSVVRDIAKDLAEMQRSIDEARRRQEAAMWAQGSKWPGIASITVTASSAPVRAGASDTARAIATAKQGAKYQVIDKVDEWYAVAFDRPIEGLSAGWVKAANAVPAGMAMYVVPSAQQSAATEGLFQHLTEQASRLRKAYQNNQYVSVSGFEISIGVPPSVSISFQFK